MNIKALMLRILQVYQSERGAVHVFVLMLIIPLIGMGGLAIDWARLSGLYQKAQQAAEVAASEAARGATNAEIERYALGQLDAYVKSAGFSSASDVVKVNTTRSGKVTRVSVDVTYTPWFAAFYGSPSAKTVTAAVATRNSIPDPNEKIFDTPGTYKWVVPGLVTEISIVAVGGGASAPIKKLSAPLYDGYPGGQSAVKNSSGQTLVSANGGGSSGSIWIGGCGGKKDGGGCGGDSGIGFLASYAGGNLNIFDAAGGGGAGGWDGNGGSWSRTTHGTNGSGGGGGAGTEGVMPFVASAWGSAGGGGGGGGVGLYGQGADGAKGGIGLVSGSFVAAGGQGGSGGESGGYGGGTYGADCGCYDTIELSGAGGWPGGGGGGLTSYNNTALYYAGKAGGGGELSYVNKVLVTPGDELTVTVGAGGKSMRTTITSFGGYSATVTTGAGGGGAVRIIWGEGRQFPATKVSSAVN
ncbi:MULTISPECIES: pilus assembly protein TadG-related protein [unclassified Xanthobacter]|uniref:pilus assembly protein TadG-related protein n=1 Tax=unclassified Xanthobacter TaxID=2623496 RepID=UPI001F1B5FC9|nr:MULTISPECIES: pilus assembly protein TadG-related protein [unclassified Xanthobacter]